MPSNAPTSSSARAPDQLRPVNVTRGFTRTAGGATRAPERRMPASEVEEADRDVWSDAVEEHELLSLDDADHDQERFLAGTTTPVMFASALQNFGVAQLLRTRRGHA